MDDFKFYKRTIDKYAEDIIINCMSKTQPHGRIQFNDDDREAMDGCVRNFLRSYIVVSTAYTESTQKLMEMYQGTIQSSPE